LDQIGGVTYPAPTSTSLPHLTIIALGFTDSVVRGMIGLLGRPDTPGPSLTIYLWLGVVALLVGLGLVLDRRRRAWVLGGLLLLVVLLPAIFDVDVAKRYGFMWQGRYTLPLAVGIPILAGAIATGPQLGPSFVRRLRLLVPAALALAGTAMFLWGLWRYSVGEPPPGHPYRLSLDPFTGTWQPPLGALAVFLIFLVGLVVYSIWLVRNVPQPHLSIARPERPSADQHERGPVVESGERPTRSTIFGGQQGDGDVGAVDDPSPRS
jgi:uncharacterized integral membrane protein